MTKAAKKQENLSLERVEQIIAPVYQYDADAEQLIPLNITKNGKTFRVVHRLRPLTDERYFALERERREAQKRLLKKQRLTMESFGPNVNLWNDLALERIGYADDPNWKEKTYYLDKSSAVTALLQFQPVTDESDALDAELLSDDDFEVRLRVLQAGTLIETIHYFREETKAQMDEYFAILSEKPNPQALASSARTENFAERLCVLYDELSTGAVGYAGRVPAWHKMAAVAVHLGYQFERVGKFSAD